MSFYIIKLNECKTWLTGQIFLLLSAHCPNWCMHPGSLDQEQLPSQNDEWLARFLLVHWKHNPNCSMQQQSQDEFQWLSSSMPVWREKRRVVGMDKVRERGENELKQQSWEYDTKMLCTKHVAMRRSRSFALRTPRISHQQSLLLYYFLGRENTVGTSKEKPILIRRLSSICNVISILINMHNILVLKMNVFTISCIALPNFGMIKK